MAFLRRAEETYACALSSSTCLRIRVRASIGGADCCHLGRGVERPLSAVRNAGDWSREEELDSGKPDGENLEDVGGPLTSGVALALFLGGGPDPISSARASSVTDELGASGCLGKPSASS